MKTYKKIEIGILAFGVLLSFILQLYVKANLNDVAGLDNIELSNESISKDFPINEFNILKLSTQSKVIIRLGEPKVRVSSDKALLEYFDVNQESKELSIDFTKIENNHPSTVEVFTNNPLSKIMVYKTDNVIYEVTDSTENTEIILKGATYFQGDLFTNSLILNAYDASSAIIGGTTNEVILGGRNAARIDARNFKAKTGKFVAQDASNITLSASETIDAESYNAANVTVLGNPRVKKMKQRDASKIEFQ